MLCLNYSRQVLFSLSLPVTVEFDAGYVDLIAFQFRFLPKLNWSCKKTQLHFKINLLLLFNGKPFVVGFT